MMKRRTVCIFALLLAVVYAGLVGVGAYLQYDAGKQFDRMAADSSNILPGEMEHYQRTVQQSESLKKVGRVLGYCASGLCLLLVLAKALRWQDHQLVMGFTLALGLLVTWPWQLKSGDHAVNYYVEQAVVVLVGLGCAALSCVAGLVYSRKRS